MGNLGKTRAEVDAMTMEDGLDLFAYWRRIPPMAETVFYANGGKPVAKESRRKDRPAVSTESEMAAFAAMVNGTNEGR